MHGGDVFLSSFFPQYPLSLKISLLKIINMSYLYFILVSFVETYYLCKSNNANKRDVVAYTLLSVCSFPIIPIIVFFIVSSCSFKEIYEDDIKPYWFELLIYIGLLIAGIMIW